MEANTELVEEVENFLEHLEDALGNNPATTVSGHKVHDLVNRLSAEYYRLLGIKLQVQHITSFDMRL
jgi:hypothetical protein